MFNTSKKFPRTIKENQKNTPRFVSCVNCYPECPGKWLLLLILIRFKFQNTGNSFCRYVAICHPFISHTMSKLSRAVKFVIGIWILALFLAIPQAVQYGIVDSHNENETVVEEMTSCTVKRKLLEHAFEISTMLLFVVPMTVITVLYILIGVKLRRSRLISSVKRTPIIGSLNHCDSGRKSNAQRNVIRMLGEYLYKNNSI